MLQAKNRFDAADNKLKVSVYKKALEDMTLALEEGRSLILKVGKNQILKLHR
jgi:hypothetical protein